MTCRGAMLLAFGFANPWLLWWLAAAAVPLLVHLWYRRQYDDTPWAAMAFLVAALRSQTRRIRLRQLLLLAVRTLVIVLLVLAVAEPSSEWLVPPPARDRRTHHVLVIDGSFSMACRHGGASRFARAKRLAARIVRQGRQGDGYSMVLMAARPRVIIAAPVFAAAGVVREIENLTLPDAGGDLTATLAAVRVILDRAGRDNRGLQRNEVDFLTDLGQTSWLCVTAARAQAAGKAAPAKAAANPSVAATQTELTKLAGMASLVVFDVGQPDHENLALTRLDTTEGFVVLGRDTVLDAVVRNFSGRSKTAETVQLWVDGARTDQKTIAVPAAGESAVRFTHRFVGPGNHVVEARLATDSLNIDNHRWLTLPVRSSLRVLCVGGKPETTRYLALALEPDPAAGGPVNVETLPESALAETDLAVYDAVFLANVDQLTTAEAKLLDRYVRPGGSLIVFLGDQVMADRYNRLLTGQSSRGVRLLPARLQNIVSKPEYGFDPLGYRHPAVEAFRGRPRSGLLTVPVYRYFRLAILPKWKGARIALAFRNGDPAIVTAPVAHGCVVLIATAASLASVIADQQLPWTFLPVWPSFLPLVRELVAYSTSLSRQQYNVRVGQPLGVSYPASAAPAYVTVETPWGSRTRQQLEGHGQDARWSFAATDKSGIYEVHLPAPDRVTARFSVNVDTAESDLRRVAHEDLPDCFDLRTRWEDTGTRPIGRFRRRDRWPRWLLAATVGLLLTETFLGWWFGRGVARP